MFNLQEENWNYPGQGLHLILIGVDSGAQAQHYKAKLFLFLAGSYLHSFSIQFVNHLHYQSLTTDNNMISRDRFNINLVIFLRLYITLNRPWFVEFKRKMHHKVPCRPVSPTREPPKTSFLCKLSFEHIFLQTITTTLILPRRLSFETLVHTQTVYTSSRQRPVCFQSLGKLVNRCQD